MAEQRSAFRFRLPWLSATAPKKSRSPEQSPPRLSYSEPYQKFEFFNPPKFQGFLPPQRNAPDEPPQSPPSSYRSPPRKTAVFREWMEPEEKLLFKFTEKATSPPESPQSSDPPSPLALSPSRDASYPRKSSPELRNGYNSQQQFLKAVFKPLSPSRKASEQQPHQLAQKKLSERQPTVPQSTERYPSEYSNTKVKNKDIVQEFTSTTAKTEEPQKQEINTAKTEQSTRAVNQEQVKMVLTEEQIGAIFKKFEVKGEKLLKKKDLKKAFYHFGFFFPHYAPINISDANKDGYIKLKDLEVLVDYALKQGYTVN